MKFSEMIKDKGFWKILIGVVSFWILLSVFILTPLMSTLDYNYNGIFSNNYKFLLGGYYYSSDDKIIIFDNSTISLRHELIHREQEKKGYPKQIFWREFEASFKQYFIWKKVNLETLDWKHD